MNTNGKVFYLDSSAIVKLTIQETESDALLRFLSVESLRYTCILADVEVVRAVRAHGSGTIQRARQILEDMDIVQLHRVVLDDAGTLRPPVVRTLDALHLAAARTLESELDALITYDRRMAVAAETLGLPVAAPGQ